MIPHLDRLRRHGAWADARLLTVARGATGDTATILRELAHIRGAQETWLSRLEQRTAAFAVWPTFTVDEIAHHGWEVDRALERYFAALTPDQLDREMTYKTSMGTVFTTPVGDMLLQMLTHGQYHRGKVNVAFRTLGMEPVNVDYISWHREQASG